MHDIVTGGDPGENIMWTRRRWRSCQEVMQCGRTAAPSDAVEILAVISRHQAECALAQPQRLFQHRAEHRGEVAGRGVDDLQHLGGRGLLLQRLTRFGNETRILDCDDRLRREVLEKCDLLVGERAHLAAVYGY